jgi:hypothetical protein
MFRPVAVALYLNMYHPFGITVSETLYRTGEKEKKKETKEWRSRLLRDQPQKTSQTFGDMARFVPQPIALTILAPCRHLGEVHDISGA